MEENERNEKQKQNKEEEEGEEERKEERKRFQIVVFGSFVRLVCVSFFMKN